MRQKAFPLVLIVSLQVGASSCTSLHEAARTGDLEVVNGFVSEGADVDEKDDEGRTPLALAVLNDRVDVAQALLEAGASTDIPLSHDARGTPLHAAIRKCRGGKDGVEMVRVLLEGGANPNAIDPESSEAPLFAAIRMAESKVAMLLLDNGADMDVRGADGQTASGLARERLSTCEKELEEKVRQLRDAGYDPNVEIPARRQGQTTETVRRLPGGPRNYSSFQISSTHDGTVVVKTTPDGVEHTYMTEFIHTPKEILRLQSRIKELRRETGELRAISRELEKGSRRSASPAARASAHRRSPLREPGS